MAEKRRFERQQDEIRKREQIKTGKLFKNTLDIDR